MKFGRFSWRVRPNFFHGVRQDNIIVRSHGVHRFSTKDSAACLMIGLCVFSTLVRSDNVKPAANSDIMALCCETTNMTFFQARHLDLTFDDKDVLGTKISNDTSSKLSAYHVFKAPIPGKAKSTRSTVGGKTRNNKAGKYNAIQLNIPSHYQTRSDPVLWVAKLATKKVPGKAKLLVENEWQGFQYQFISQWQGDSKQPLPGTYLSIYGKQLMASWGGNGTQWRTVLGYAAHEHGFEGFHPAIEGWYEDNSRRGSSGSKDLIVSGSLGYRQGALAYRQKFRPSAGSKTLRYWDPNFNNRLSAWEIGELVDFRYHHKSYSNGKTENKLDTALYPGQLFAKNSLFNTLFVGIGIASPNFDKDEISALFGYNQRYGKFGSSTRIQHDFNRNDTSLIFSLNHWL